MHEEAHSMYAIMCMYNLETLIHVHMCRAPPLQPADTHEHILYPNICLYEYVFEGQSTAPRVWYQLIPSADSSQKV